MAYTADTLAYDVISEMGPRELKGPVWMLGRKYNLPKGVCVCAVALLL